MQTENNSSTPVKVERDQGVGIVRLNRPQQLNALNLEMREAIATAFDELSADPAIRVIVVTGGEKVFAAGAAGSELMQMCDIVVADTSARIGQPEAKVGIMPGAGGTQRLARSVGKPVASLMLMCGEALTGERAYQLGLVSELAEGGQALNRALELARKVTFMPPRAMHAIKRALRQGSDLPLQEALQLEQDEFQQLFDTTDQAEGMTAFLEKRKPTFTGN